LGNVKRLLFFCPFSYGGLADYAHAQATALTVAGCDVTMLCQPEFISGHDSSSYRQVPLLAKLKEHNTSNVTGRLIRKVDNGLLIIKHISQLAAFIREHNFQHVLFASYVEYLAPLWAYKLRRLSKAGVRFGAVVHDPVRDFVVGPIWWHRYSIWSAYSFLSEAFVHEAIELDTVKEIPRLRTTVIPCGIFKFTEPDCSVTQMREGLDVPQDATLLLAFGHIRDGKNLDLVLKALVHFPDVYLVIAGKEQSSGQRPVSWYQRLAEELGVQHRCRWICRFIPEQEAANLFGCCDVVLLVYSAQFRSASGVLNVAANFRKPCLVSSGNGPLKSVVETYRLGTFNAPDSEEAIIDGLSKVLSAKDRFAMDWCGYERDYSWEKNAMITINTIYSCKSN